MERVGMGAVPCHASYVHHYLILLSIKLFLNKTELTVKEVGNGYGPLVVMDPRGFPPKTKSKRPPPPEIVCMRSRPTASSSCLEPAHRKWMMD